MFTNSSFCQCLTSIILYPSYVLLEPFPTLCQGFQSSIQAQGTPYGKLFEVETNTLAFLTQLLYPYKHMLLTEGLGWDE